MTLHKAFTIGAALPVSKLAQYSDWLLADNRDLEIQDAFRHDVLDGDWRALAAQAKSVLGDYKGRLGVHGPFEGLALMSGDPQVQRLAESRLLQGLAFAEEVGATHMVVHSPFLTLGHAFVPVSPTAKREDLLKRVLDTLSRVIAQAERQNCTLVVENIFDLHPEPWMWLIGSLNSAHVKPSIDVGHAFCMHRIGGASPDAFARAAGSLLTHVHIQDTDGLSDRHWAPGDGNINWHAFFQALSSSGADPRLVLELADYERIPQGAAYLQSRGFVR
jgi:sugar phosphate isomerase/epimerase